MSASVYRAFDSSGALLYVGHSTRVLGRLDEHAATKDWWKRVANVTVEHFDSRMDASAAEAAAIECEAPEMNLQAGRMWDQDDALVIQCRRLVGQRIRDARRDIGLTQNEVAMVVGVKQPAVAQWERGRTLPAVRLHDRIADALRTTRSRLFRELDARDEEAAS